MPYDPERDFAPIAPGFRTPNVLVVSRRLPVGTLAELVACAKARPGQVACASPGSGTSSHLLIELFNIATGAGRVHVPCRAASGSAPDLMAGNLACSMDQIATALPAHRDGKVRIVGLAMPQRSPLLPAVPTLAEIGRLTPGVRARAPRLARARLAPAPPTGKLPRRSASQRGGGDAVA